MEFIFISSDGTVFPNYIPDHVSGDILVGELLEKYRKYQRSSVIIRNEAGTIVDVIKGQDIPPQATDIEQLKETVHLMTAKLDANISTDQMLEDCVVEIAGAVWA